MRNWSKQVIRAARSYLTGTLGMVFNVVVSLQNLKTVQGKNYTILIADTVAVKQTGNEILTAKIPKKYEDISYALEVN